MPWLIGMVQSNRTIDICNKIAALGGTAYSPRKRRQMRPAHVRRPKVSLIEAAYPGYVFIDAKHQALARKAADRISFIHEPGRIDLVEIDDAAIDAIRADEDVWMAEALPPKPFRAGDKVRITFGMMRGAVGTVFSVNTMRRTWVLIAGKRFEIDTLLLQLDDV
jgi:transcription antitermination factor NusG